MKKGSIASKIWIGAFSFFLWVNSSAETLLPQNMKSMSVGNVDCASSPCHGSVVPWNQSSVLQNEYLTWKNADRHSQSYQVLLSQKSIQIAKKLSLPQPAHLTTQCLNCHTHNPDKKFQGANFSLQDGVGCESCHGNAEKWGVSHTKKGVTHQENIKNGLYPTSQPVALAKLCNSCHVGNTTNFASHRLMAAGHPRLSIEINTFLKIQPPHYLVDEDYKLRKGDISPVKKWAIGQAETITARLEMLSDPKRNHQGIFPELALFECSACHHPLGSQQRTSKINQAPGVLRLNDSGLLMLRAIIQVAFPDKLGQFNSLVTGLDQSLSEKNTLANPLENIQDNTKKLLLFIQQMVPALEAYPFRPEKIREIFLALVKGSPDYSNYADAEQAYMALSSIGEVYLQNYSKNAIQIKNSMAQLSKELANKDQFQSQNFIKEYSKFTQFLQVQNGVQ